MLEVIECFSRRVLSGGPGCWRQFFRHETLLISICPWFFLTEWRTKIGSKFSRCAHTECAPHVPLCSWLHIVHPGLSISNFEVAKTSNVDICYPRQRNQFDMYGFHYSVCPSQPDVSHKLETAASIGSRRCFCRKEVISWHNLASFDRLVGLW